MRILHTSDWHLGRSFHRVGMLEHQAAFADHLLDVVEAEKIDVVVVSGDVYDRALPPVDAVDLADQILSRLAASRAKVILSSGNHDSVQRLGFGSRMMDGSGVFVRTRLADAGRSITLEDKHGPVAFYPLPFLEPDHAVGAWGLTARSHEAAVAEAMRRVHADLATRGPCRSVVMAHAFVAGCSPSDSERDISVGGVQMVSADLFAGIDYVALGHLHGAQEVSPSIRYSGSPLAYSFSEASQRKGSWIVDLGADGLKDATFVPAPRPRRLARLRGDLDTLLTDPDLAEHESSWVQVTLTDQARPVAAMERLRTRFPDTLALAFEPRGTAESTALRRRLEGRSDHDIALAFIQEMRGAPATEAEQTLLRSAVDACCADPDQRPEAS